MSASDPLRVRSPGERLRSADITELVQALGQDLRDHTHQAEGQRLGLDCFQAEAQLEVKDLETGVLTLAGEALSSTPAHEGATERIRSSLSTGFSSAGGELGGDLTVDGSLTVTGNLQVQGQLILGEQAVPSSAQASGVRVWQATQSAQLEPGAQLAGEGTGERLRRPVEQLVVSLEVQADRPSILLLRGSVRLTTYDNSGHYGYGEWGTLSAYFPAFGKVALFAVSGGVSVPLDIGMDSSLRVISRTSSSRSLGTLLPAQMARAGGSTTLDQWQGACGWGFFHPENSSQRRSQRAFLEEVVVCGTSKVTLELRAYTTNTLITEGVLEAIGLPSELPP